MTMIKLMRYPGGKGKTYQHIINLMPPHRVYIESHLGGGAVMRNKKPVDVNIGIDADPNVIAAWPTREMPHVDLLVGTAERFLSQYDFRGDELVYSDPPYHPDTRRQQRVYSRDYSVDDHKKLIEVLTSLPCKVILSGYTNSLYNSLLDGWETRTFSSKTHVDVREETLWFNFAPPLVLHDSRYMGNDFRARQATKRRLQRMQDKVTRMDPVERAAFSQWLNDLYPCEYGSKPL
ncbi:MAG: DNA adenine methylase [Parvibaculum sp.]|nr:DNA adenine methylase [Parvibaculum sp.]